MTTSAARSHATAKAKPLEHAPHSPHLIAGRPEGACGVTAALLAAGAAGKPPRVGGTAVTGLPHHVGEAPALPRGRLALAALRALAVLLDSAQVVADALCEGKSMAPRCQFALSLLNSLEFAFHLFSMSPEAWADAGTSPCLQPGLADPMLNATQQYSRALLMSQAGHLYGFCPSTQEATGDPWASSPAFLLSPFPLPVHNQRPRLPTSCQPAVVANLLATGLHSPTQQPIRPARLCPALRERSVCLPTAWFSSLAWPLLPRQDALLLSSHICRDAGVNKSQTHTLSQAISAEEGNKDR